MHVPMFIVLQMRPSAFPAAPSSSGSPAPQEKVSEEALAAASAQAGTGSSQLLSRELTTSARPELGSAK